MEHNEPGSASPANVEQAAPDPANNSSYVITTEAINRIIQATQRDRESVQTSGFPIFDPDHSRADVQTWCADIDLRAKRDRMENFDIIPRVQSSLKGRAKKWYEKYGYQHYGWIDLRASLVHAFSCGADIVSQLRSVANSESNEFPTYTDYVMEKVAQINRLPFDIPEDKIVKILIGCISDTTLRNSLNFASPTSVQRLIDHLSTIREKPYKKNELQIRHSLNKESSFSQCPPKRARIENEKRCYGCGKIGHIRPKCPNSARTSNSAPNIPKKNEVVSERPECTFCGKAGHNEQMCWAKQRADRRTVNICKDVSLPENRTPVIINGKLYHSLLDTGSDCSLMRADVAKNMVCEKRPYFLSVVGIGVDSILLSEAVDVLVEFEELTIEITFHIIENEHMKNDLLIGRDVLKDPTLSIVVNCFGSALCREVSAVGDRVASKAFSGSCEAGGKLKDILDKYRSNFITGFPNKVVTTGALNIKLIKDVNVYYAPYRMALSEREITANIVSDLLAHGIVRESKSPFASPVILVRKKNGQNRLCVDYRALNKVTVKDRYPLPRIEDQLDRLVGNKFFSSLDMASGFHQIPIEEESIEKTAFITPDGHFEYMRMPFGLANAPAIFQRAINIALGNLKDKIALVYMDDVLIPSKTVEEGMQHLDSVLKALTDCGFSLNMQKCRFLQEKIGYLGREVTAAGVRPSTTKIDALVRSPQPNNVKQVRQFMGLANYFRKFVPAFAAKTACITALTKNNAKFLWDDECEKANLYILNILTKRPVLVLFDSSLPTELHTDASALGFWAILFQKIQGQLHVVAYYSQATKGYETNYHSYELETLAVVNAVKHFRHYLLGIKFIIATDCNALKATKQKKDLIPRIARWWVYLQDFDFDITYKKGKSMLHVDYLSRNPPSKSCCQVKSLSETWLHLEQKNDIECCEIIGKIKSDDSSTKSQYKIKSGLLYKKIHDGIKLCIPQSCRLSLIRRYHEDNCHIGWEKPLEKMREHFWMPSMTRNVRKFVENCLICLVAKRPSGKKQCSLHPIDKTPVPFSTVHLDYMGPFKNDEDDDNRYIFIIIDGFTKFVVLFPCKSLRTSETIDLFNNYIMLFGVPNKIVSDRGTNFTSEDFKKLCTSFGIEHHMIAPGSSRANGQVERYVDTVCNLLRTKFANCVEWTTYVSRVQLALNTTINKSTGFSPLKLLTGVTGRTPEVGALLSEFEIEPQYENIAALRKLADERLKENATNMKVRFDQSKCKPQPLKIGQQVLYQSNQIRKTKLQPFYEGPYEIVGILANDRYKLKKDNSKAVIVVARDKIRLVQENGVTGKLIPRKAR